MNKPKVYIGTVSKNVIDSVIELANFYEYPLGLIPSRRQIDYENSYVMTTRDFVDYVKANSEYITIERDHAGLGQGTKYDNGFISVERDAENGFDIIHVDPYKFPNLKVQELTRKYIVAAHSRSKWCQYEIGTEEAIHRLTESDLESLILYLKQHLPHDLFINIRYLVIQSGTALNLLQRINTGVFDAERFKSMIELANKYSLHSKEHNGDYLSFDELRYRFENGLNAINIAPEVGQIESEVLYKKFNTYDRERFFTIVKKYKKRWNKWVSSLSDYTPEDICIAFGHYVFQDELFKTLKLEYGWMIDEEIKIAIKKRLYEIIKATDNNF